MTMASRALADDRHAGGFTLIELLVAVTVSMLVLGSVALVFAGTSSSRGDVERSARLADNAHYTVALLTEELHHAGYYAELMPLGATWQVPDPCATTLAAQGWSQAPFTMPVGIAGYAAADPNLLCMADRKAGTAFAVVRRVSSTVTPPAEATVGGYLQVSKCLLDAAPFVVSHVPTDFTLRDLDCATVAEVRQLVVRTYYVAACNVCGSDTFPTLKRAEWIGGEIVVTPIAEGVENLQLEYGFDANGDGEPDKFLAQPDAALGPEYGKWANVMAARVHVLFRSTDTQFGHVDTKQFDLGPAGVTQPAHDGYRRILLTALAIPRNPAGQRENP
jgi:type IV pilus assembly protein PilW